MTDAGVRHGTLGIGRHHMLPVREASVDTSTLGSARFWVRPEPQQGRNHSIRTMHAL